MTEARAPYLNQELEILFEDQWLVAVNKPSGILTHRSPIAKQDTVFMLQAVRKQIRTKVFTVHRLDRATSGVLLFAKTKSMVLELGQQFMRNHMAKKYVAVVRGWLDGPVCCDHAIRDENDNAHPAKSVVSPLAQVELPISTGKFPTSRYGMVSVETDSGRRHQVRRHLKHLAHPIVGDTTYGKGPHNRLFRDHFQSNRLLLHAASIALDHPQTGQPIAIHAPPTVDFAMVIDALGWQAEMPNYKFN